MATLATRSAIATVSYACWTAQLYRAAEWPLG